MNKKHLINFYYTAIIIFLSSCAANKASLVDETQLKTMKEVYQERVAQPLNNKIALRPIRSDNQDLIGHAKNIESTLNEQFPRLENPDLVVYIRPHFRGKAPVPGYYTKLSLYKNTPYRLQGELLPYPSTNDLEVEKQ